MRRWLFTICSAVSLALCVAVVFLRVRSYRVADSVGWSRPNGDWAELASVEGGLQVDWGSGIIAPPEGEWHCQSVAVDARDRVYVYDIVPIRSYDSTNPPNHAVVVADWFTALLLGLTPTAWMLATARRYRQRRRRITGHCPSCGYDLRATPDRCPECGAVPAAR
jgi:hypothetical protein